MDTATPQPAFLGVEQSLTGRRWVLRGSDDRLALALSQRLGLPEVVGRVLAGRGVGLDAAETFLEPTLKAMLPDPFVLKDMESAVRRLETALTARETIAVFGDYDVDGATSSALLLRYLRLIGADPLVHIPDRMTEGYGPNAPALLRLREKGATVAITVDCGITAFEPLAAAAAAGLDVIVVDHHAAEPRLPTAAAVVNPNRMDEDGTLGTLAACGVVFLLLVALNRALRRAGYFNGHRPEPDLRLLLDIVALGTVADVVPLTGLNRAFVAQGLKVMAGRRNAGINALAEVAGLKDRADAYALGFMLGPRVNAGGRVGESGLGAELLSCDDPAAALEIARKLDGYNAERKEIEAAVLLEAIEQVEGSGADAVESIIAAAGPGWHTGVVGIVASRLKERYNRPALVGGIEDANDGLVVKGSGRSVVGVDLGSAVIAARQAGLALAGGGHKMAAGFSVALDRWPDFVAFLAERVGRDIDAMGGLTPTLALDGALDASGATVELCQTLEQVGPYGAGNATPRFVIAGARVAFADIVGQGHVRCRLEGTGGGSLKAIAFRAADSDLGVALLNAQGGVMHLAGTIRPDTWQGRTQAQLIIDDGALVS